MLKKLLFLTLLLSVSSCSIQNIRYLYDFKTMQHGLDFTRLSNLWLLHTIDIPEQKEGRQVDKILKKFNKWTKNKTTLTSNMTDNNGKNIPLIFSETISTENLAILKQVANYHYFINVYLQYPKTNTSNYTITEMMFDIYDIIPI